MMSRPLAAYAEPGTARPSSAAAVRVPKVVAMRRMVCLPPGGAAAPVAVRGGPTVRGRAPVVIGVKKPNRGSRMSRSLPGVRLCRVQLAPHRLADVEHVDAPAEGESADEQ